MHGSEAPAVAPAPEAPAGGTRRVRRRAPRVLLLAASLVGAGVVATGGWWGSCGFRGCPTDEALRRWTPGGGRIVDREGRTLGTVAPARQLPVPVRTMPRHLLDAVIAVEDRRFRDHHGVDWRGVLRAAWVNARTLDVREGASTITMQLARLAFLGGGARDESLARKLLEVRYAGRLERALTKDGILGHYLNSVYLGEGATGVEAASRIYFGHGVAELSLAEAALLAGLAQAPSATAPRAHAGRALARRAVVLERMVQAGVLDAARARAAAAEPLRLVADPRAALAAARRDRAPTWAGEVVRTVLDSLRRDGALPRWAADEALVVHTTVDARAQRAAERAVARGAAQLDARRPPWADPVETQGALVALDPASGAIRAIVGGRRLDRAGFDRARRAHRPVGSAFKPFVYAAALADTLTVATLVEDAPVAVPVGRDVWRPANVDDRYAGPITVRAAVARSANAAAVRVAQAVGLERIAAVAHRAGVRTPLPRVPALALGAAALTPLELTAAYAPFANGGRRITPHLVTRIEDTFGRVLWQAPAPRVAPALDPRDAFLVQSLLRSVVDEGTARGVRAAGIRGPVAGKTGTTNDATDVWFVGFTPTLVAGVWLGADAPVPLPTGASGGRDAVPVWAQFLRAGWHPPEQDDAWTPPPGLVRARVDVRTGLIAADWCGESRLDWFKAGTAPTRPCTDAPAGAGEWPLAGDPDEADDATDADAPAGARRAPPRVDGELPEWLLGLPEVLGGERLPSREEVEAAARDLARLRARMDEALARAREDGARQQRDAARAPARQQADRAAREARRAREQATRDRLRLDLD